MTDRSFRQQMQLALVAVPCTALLSACSVVEGYPTNPDSNTTLTALQTKYFGADSEDAYNSISASDPNYATLRKSKRDEIILGRIRAYDIEFSDFQRALNSYSNEISIGADLTALVLNGLGATTGNAGTKAALAAASAGVIGAQGAVNKDLYYQKTVSAIIAQMEANRSKAKLVIFTDIKQPDADYPLARADSDLADLNDAGSLPNAVSNITQQSTTQNDATQAQIQAVQALTFTTSTSATKITAWLFSNGTVDKTHYAALQTWLNAQPEAFLKGKDYPPAALASGDDPNNDLEPIRQRALSDASLKIPH